MKRPPPRPPNKGDAIKRTTRFNIKKCFTRSSQPHKRAHLASLDPKHEGPGPHHAGYLNDVEADAVCGFAALALRLAEAHDDFDGALVIFRQTDPHLDFVQADASIERAFTAAKTRLKASRSRRADAASRATAFRKAADRPALPIGAYRPRGVSRRSWLMLGCAFILEVALTGVLIGPELNGGLPTGLAVALIVGIILVGCSFVAGAVGYRLMSHKDGAQRLRGAAALTVSVLLALALILVMARLRLTSDAAALPGVGVLIALSLAAFQLFALGLAAWKFSGGPGMPWSRYWGEADAYRDLHRLDQDKSGLLEALHAEIDVTFDGWIATAKASCLRQKEAQADLIRAAGELRRAVLECRRDLQRVLVEARQLWRLFEAAWHSRRPHDALVALTLVAPEIAPIDALVERLLAAGEAAVDAAERTLAERLSKVETMRAEAHDRVDDLVAEFAADFEGAEPVESFDHNDDDLPSAAPEPAPSQSGSSWWTRILPWGRA